MNTAKTVTLDVREDIRCGREPFSKIMSTVAALNADEQLLLIAPFEPAPLFAVLGRQGFQHRSQSVANGDWEVLFTRQAGPAASAPPAATPPPCPERAALKADADVLEVDARGLEPPQPLVKILEALATLPDGATLNARTDRRPMHLYAQLEERGFTGTSAAQSDGSFITQICRR
ncbi:MAG TPA: DUF2249 domain-containing protein [Verrucomicrobiae bacterium]|nr:DUF2249 domain-containing protein [Verrucomicrobiae bacterium]